MNNELKYTFDDFILKPSYSKTDIRGTKFSSTSLFDFGLDIPIIASPMDSITGIEMMKGLNSCGAIGIHHRYCSDNELENAASLEIGGIAISPSMGIDNILKIHSLYPKTFFCFDVAHGDTKKNLDFCQELTKNGIYNIITGNIVSPGAVQRYLKIGINTFRVGVGGGSVCLTRVVTGFGYPQASAIKELYDEFKMSIDIISDGGHKTTGDIIKAFSLGAKYVMLGRMLSGTSECIMSNLYRGMASEDALKTRKNNFFIEGDKVEIKFKGSVVGIIEEIKKAIEQACFYGGVEYYRDLINVKKVMITNNAYVEGNVRK